MPRMLQQLRATIAHSLAVLAVALFLVTPSFPAVTLFNDGFSQDRFSRTVSAAAQFPFEECTVLWSVYHYAVTDAQYKSYFSIAQTTFGGGNEYMIAFAGATGSANLHFAIGSQGGDTFSTTDTPAAGQWYYQGFRLRKRTTNDYEQLYFPTLPTLTNVISRDRTAAITPIGGTTRLSFGAVPYTTNEGIEGSMANIWIFKGALPTAYMAKQVRSRELLNPEYAEKVWAHYLLDVANNQEKLFDVSGNGRHLITQPNTLNAAIASFPNPPQLKGREVPGVYPLDVSAPAGGAVDETFGFRKRLHQ